MPEREVEISSKPDEGAAPDGEPEQATSSGTPAFTVGIGASAGGLDALEKFFTHLPPDTGVAFIIVTHMDPSRPGMMPEILSRFTKMPVHEASDGMTVRADTVYIIPSDADLSIMNGTLFLNPPEKTRGVRMPIDSFFRSLADDQGRKAISLLLSGMGSDGTFGIRAIKEHLGTVMVQDPNTTTFKAMPESAIATGMVDFIAPAEALPDHLLKYAGTAVSAPGSGEALDEESEAALLRILMLIRTRTGHDFSGYKRNMIYRRIERRMNIHQLSRVTDYIRYLQQAPQEVANLHRDLLIGVTQFFREPDAWDALKQHLLSDLLPDRPEGTVLRVWVPGCSTGEEAFTLAIILRECLDSDPKYSTMQMQIYATDLDAEAIDKARLGRYSVNIGADVAPERLERFFVREEDEYLIKKEIRDSMVFAVQNVISDPPFTRLDILCCRNLLIYFTADLQKRIIPIFHYALSTGGLLFLGSAESINGFVDIFQPLDTKWKIFSRRAVGQLQARPVEFPTRSVPRHAPAPGEGARPEEIPVPTLANQLLVDLFAPPTVLINPAGDIVYFHGKTPRYLEHPGGKATLNIYVMAREEIRRELAPAVRAAHNEDREVQIRDIELTRGGRTEKLDLRVTPVHTPGGGAPLLMVAFQRVMPPAPAGGSTAPDGDPRCRELENELKISRSRLQATVEEMEASQEEMRSMNEEMQSTNEELQSTNEELITSKEELQSLNEELLTVNAELQKKIEEAAISQEDMRNLMNSTDIGIIFLDSDLRVRRFTPKATALVNLIPSDIGRPITDLVSHLVETDIGPKAQNVLETLIPQEAPVESRDGGWYLMRVLPYRTAENRIDGVTITFLDVTRMKQLERSVVHARNYAENIVSTVREPLLVLDADLHIVSANPSFYQLFRVSREETVGKPLYLIGDRQWDIPALRRLLEDVLPRDTYFENYMVEHDFPAIGRRKILLNARKVAGEHPGDALILLVMEDVTGQPCPEEQESRPET